MADLTNDGEAYAEAIIKDAVYDARNAGSTITAAALAAAETLNPLIWSDASVGDGPLEWHDVDTHEPYQVRRSRRLTWKELYEREHEARLKLEPFKRFVVDLDRCQHGRHEGDVCSSASGCDGPSKGNLRLSRYEERHGVDPDHPTHVMLGHDMSGRAYTLRRPVDGGAAVVLKAVHKNDSDVTVTVHELGEQ